MARHTLCSLASLLALLLPGPLHAADEDPFAANVRPTPPLAPQEERLKLEVPPGFEVQLVAAEPDIQKPMNMAFDSRGRLWVTGTVEYPFPVGENEQGRDTIKILEDTNGDGRADRITTFADGLNIPIGLYPFGGNRCIVYSIPNIYLLEDTDGDDRADRREVLYGPVGFADTHGMQNAFRRNFDGWLNICHGFANNSTIEGGDHSEVKLQSGNTYRVRLDGSRVEQVTWGQVNPFGMTLDARGNLFTADCHSVPITQLLRGAYYPSFGKPHDGLGFGPAVMTHLHGSTAIAGIILYEGDQFPQQYRGDVMVGNVMTSRVNRDKLEYDGSTITAREAGDFVISHDPWFRPVDLQIAPDGSLYVADFYNRIIGHYEVPLDHPGRDRERGRIWRIVYTGDGSEAATPAPGDLSTASTDALIAALGHPTLTTRLLATHELVDRVGTAALEPAQAAFADSDDPKVRAHALWVVQRLGGLDDATLATACRDPAPLVRVHAMRVLGEMDSFGDAPHQLAVAALTDDDAFVRREAAEALAQHPDPADVAPLLAALGNASGEDRCLQHAIRIALRNVWRAAGERVDWLAAASSPADADALADVAPAVPNVSAGEYLVGYLEQYQPIPDRLGVYLRHAARYLPSGAVDRLVALVRNGPSSDAAEQAELLGVVQDALDARGEPATVAMRQWADDIVGRLLPDESNQGGGWHALPLPGGQPGPNPWDVQRRTTAGGRRARFLSTLPAGEQLTGVLRSDVFAVPATLTFEIAGHDEFPDQPPAHANLVRLCDAETAAVLAVAYAPRHDQASKVAWVLDEHVGKQAYLEIVDGLSLSAFAWIAVGQFEPAVASVPSVPPRDLAHRQSTAAELVRRYDLPGYEATLGAIARDPHCDLAARGQVLAALADGEMARAMAGVVNDGALGATLRDAICEAVVAGDVAQQTALISETMKTTPAAVQTRLAEQLASTPAGADTLLSLIEHGQASPRLLARESLAQRVTAARPDDAPRRIEQLVADLPPRSEELDRQIAERIKAFATAGADAADGKAVFTKRCALCHQIGGEGNVVGPQLDGIGARGLDRLVEDVVDPNRNVDQSFRAVTFVLEDGRVLQGLPRSEDESNVVVANNEGKEFVLRIDQIEERAASPQSLMPDNFVEQLTPAELNQLLAYLLTQRTPGPEPTTPGSTTAAP
ncbi:MAG: c-type cytochrome [Planctomycetales bacterium]|nr:c-type cytochrome [Planctomycetales bacterium]